MSFARGYATLVPRLDVGELCNYIKRVPARPMAVTSSDLKHAVRHDMEIFYDAEKRALILESRSLDFDDAVKIFAGTALTVEDDRKEYGETRYLTLGMLGDRLVAVVWTPRGQGRHIITMWKANDRERKRYETSLE